MVIGVLVNKVVDRANSTPHPPTSQSLLSWWSLTRIAQGLSDHPRGVKPPISSSSSSQLAPYARRVGVGVGGKEGCNGFCIWRARRYIKSDRSHKCVSKWVEGSQAIHTQLMEHYRRPRQNVCGKVGPSVSIGSLTQ